MPPTSNIFLQRNVRSPKKKISKLLLAFFFISQSVGFDFGFTLALRGKYRLIIQRIFIFVTFFNVVVSWIGIVFFNDNSGYWLNKIEFTAYALVFYTAKYKLYNLIYDINCICELTTKQIKILGIVTIVYVGLMYSTKSALIIVRCISGKEPQCETYLTMLHFVFYVVIVLSLDIIGVMQIVITYYFKYSVNIITVLLKKPQRKLDEFKKCYTAIADCYDKIKPVYNWVVSVFYFQYRPNISSRVSLAYYTSFSISDYYTSCCNSTEIIANDLVSDA